MATTVASRGRAAVPLRMQQTLELVLGFGLRKLQSTSTFVKYLALLLFIVNAGAWPFVWHFRVFHFVLPDNLSYLALYIRHLFTRRKKWALALQDWNERRMAIGINPFRQVWTYKWRVDIHEGDLFMHMSNSSYAAVLDRTRMHLATMVFPTLLRIGGMAPLAAMHYHFIREIPTLSHYQVRATIVAWDQKWFYAVFRFVRPASGKDQGKGKKIMPDPSPIAATPLPAPTNGVNHSNGSADPDDIMKAIAARAVHEPEPDGATLYTVVVNQFCFKVGRISVPPAVVFACNGLYTPADPESAPAKGPAPPWWETVREINRSNAKIRKFFSGGWREMPPEQRFWEQAFGPGEEIRQARLEAFTGQYDAPQKGGLAGSMELVKQVSRLPVVP
ncbi:hypothetical protein HMN09_00552100 [Mycena chlorophos]|uniref:Thioesterase/thiol ester dehydrase-isomerase n=1 Tax=Mycena chlorophos TaxID=658473 RepID=A0A8H6WGF6_MYCCL|nr:hypothetical protein HMN09_00552100 [Mycena chlorophos]